MKWIKCSDRLPEIGRDVLAYRKDGIWDEEIIITQLIRIFENYTSWEDEVKNYSHWMPLPKPPKDEK